MIGVIMLCNATFVKFLRKYVLLWKHQLINLNGMFQWNSPRPSYRLLPYVKFTKMYPVTYSPKMYPSTYSLYHIPLYHMPFIGSFCWKFYNTTSYSGLSMEIFTLLPFNISLKPYIPLYHTPLFMPFCGNFDYNAIYLSETSLSWFQWNANNRDELSRFKF